MRINSIKKLNLVPRKKGKEYDRDFIKFRRKWVARQTNARVLHIGRFLEKPEEMKKNIENLIGTVQIPVGITGPLKINGKFAKGMFYVPFATTQGTLVECYHRGMIALTQAGGVNVTVQKNEVSVSPVFIFRDISEVNGFIMWVSKNFKRIKQEAEKTTKHGRLLKITPYSMGKIVILNFSYFTKDAMGLNMISIATNQACSYISKKVKPQRYYLRSNLSSDKKASYFNLITGYGKEVSVEAVLPKQVVELYLHTSPEEMYEFWHASIFGSLQSGMIGTNAHFANGLTAIFLACGQDVAQVVNASVGISMLEITKEGDLYVYSKLPSLIVGTIGGGTGLPTQRECLQIMGCFGEGKAEKFSEIVAAALLAGEVSIAGALASGEFAMADIDLRAR